MYDRKDKAVDHQKRLLVKILRLDSLRMSGGVEDLSEMAQGSSWLREKVVVELKADRGRRREG